MTEVSDVISLGEARSTRSGDSADWKPRDVLDRVLRMIDSGEIDPDALVVAWSERRDGKRHGRFYQATPDPLISLGLLQATIFKMQE
jgi:hypothetical protein